MTLTAPHDTSRRDPSAPLRHVDWVLMASTIGIAVLGTLMVFSATRGNGEVADTSFLKRQAAFMVLGFVAMIVITIIDYHRLRDYAPFIYGGALLLLVAVISPLGSSSKGAQAWFSIGPYQLQPAEFAKLATIVAFATLLAQWQGDIDPKRLGILLGVAALPMGLIMLQPDLGTALVFVAVTLAMLLVGGVRARYLFALLAVGLIGTWALLQSNVLQEYQKDRLTTFLDPGTNRSTTAYNLNQSIIAISRGGTSGDGLFEGRQTQLRYVPEQQTDFIFTVVGEELGFLGGALFLGLAGIVIWRIWRTSALARDPFGQLLCVGVLAVFVFQIFENVGMTMGIMPVTGIPLPLMSYGGSTTLTSFLAIGIVQSVHMRRFR